MAAVGRELSSGRAETETQVSGVLLILCILSCSSSQFCADWEARGVGSEGAFGGLALFCC